MKKNKKEYYIEIAKFLHDALGSEYEIVLHDFHGDEHSIVYMANGHISGREIDNYTDDPILESLDEEMIKNNNYVTNREGIIDNNKVIRHSSFFIKDENNELEGILCVNFDGSKYVNIAKKILQLTHMENASIESDRLYTYNFQNNVPEVVSDIAQSVFDESLELSNIPADRLTQEEKIELIRELNDKGVFLMKGSISNAAEKLGVSKATIYRYLQMVTDENEE